MPSATAWLLLPSHLVAKDPPADLVLTPLGGEARPLSEWLTTFHLATVALDPYTNESAWILPTATRILEGLRGSDARVNLLVTAPEDDVRAFLGPLVREFLVFVDDDRRSSRRSGSKRCRHSCSSGSTAPFRPLPKDGIPRSGATSPKRSPTPRHGSRPTSR